MSDLILDSLEIKNFRTFKHLVIEKFGRVNLVVGKNGVGKSSLLEALMIYAGRANLSLLREILKNRKEQSLTLSSQKEIPFYDFGRFFYGGPTALSNLVGHKICIGRHDQEADAIEIELGWFEPTPYENNPTRWFYLASNVPKHPQATIGLQITKNDKVQHAHVLESFTVDYQHSPIVQKTGIHYEFIEPFGLNAEQMVRYSDVIALTPLEKEVNQAMQIIDPFVQEVRFVANLPNSSNRIPMAKTNGSRISVQSLGEGAIRILGIALALVNAQDGFLIIDEIESGLHYSVQLKTWELIFRLAEELKIQVFATTHSDDCVKAFQYVAQRDEAVEGVLIRLEKWKEFSKAIIFDEERLTTAVEGQIEIR